MECSNCGCNLRGSRYIHPWEDGNNEYGYWICRNCRHKEIDWTSSDDDDNDD